MALGNTGTGRIGTEVESHTVNAHGERPSVAAVPSVPMAALPGLPRTVIAQREGTWRHSLGPWTILAVPMVR